MIVLDTDHINALQYEGTQATTLIAGMRRCSDQDFATTIITVEEQMRGWLALIHRSIRCTLSDSGLRTAACHD